MAEIELGEQLAEAGRKLLKPPSDVNELLSLLEQVEGYLVKVEQSPSKMMLAALDPSKDALVANEFLKHSDMDVKVAVASCISEITRITAPEAPYNDELMKEIFRVIVASFEDLFEASSRSHSKRVSILETVAKVRSCVVMLDLECDDLIVEMFQHFLKETRDTIPESIFSSMETIMTLVLEESEDVSSELLSCLLNSVKKERQDASPVAYKLGEKVISICASKLRPYLVHEMKSKGMSAEDYSTVVASICEEASGGVVCDDLNTTGEQVGKENKLSDGTDSDEPPLGDELVSKDGDVDTVAKTPASPSSNGAVQTGKDPNSPKTKSDHLPLVTKASRGTSKRGRKPKAVSPSVDVSENSRIASEHQPAEVPVRKDDTGKDNNSLSDGLAVKDSASLDPEKKGELSSQPHQESANAGVQSPNQPLPDSGGRPKRGRPPGKKKVPIVNTEADKPATLSELKASVSGDQVAEGTPEAPDIKTKEGESSREVEIKKDQSKNRSSMDANDDDTLLSASRSSQKELSVEKEDKIKRHKGAHSAEKLISRGSSKKKGSSEKSVAKISTGGQNQLQETPKVKSKRKRSMVEEGSEPALDENLIGSRIEVWWPDDKEFYRGKVVSYDSVEKKHKVEYDDGDEEILLLKEEKFNVIVSDDEEQAADPSTHDVSSERRQKKKMKNSPESSSKPAKIVSKRGSSSTGKLKTDGARSLGHKGNDTPKSSSKMKENTLKDSKMKDNTPKDSKMKAKDDNAVIKSKEGPKSGSKSKDESLSGSKSKDESTPRTGSKSKTDLKASGKSNTNGSSSVKARTGHLKTSRSDDSAKGKSGSVDAQESAGQSGKKRRRKVLS